MPASAPLPAPLAQAMQLEAVMVPAPALVLVTELVPVPADLEWQGWGLQLVPSAPVPAAPVPAQGREHRALRAHRVKARMELLVTEVAALETLAWAWASA